MLNIRELFPLTFENNLKLTLIQFTLKDFLNLVFIFLFARKYLLGMTTTELESSFQLLLSEVVL